MCREKQWTISSIFCLLNPEFIQVAFSPELHKVFWTIPHSAIESRGQRECKMSFRFISFWRKHQITNPFISAHTAEEQWGTMARTRPAPAWWCYQKILVRWLIHALPRAPLSLLGSLTLPVGDTIYKTTKQPFRSTFKPFSEPAVFSEQRLHLGESCMCKAGRVKLDMYWRWKVAKHCQVISD